MDAEKQIKIDIQALFDGTGFTYVQNALKQMQKAVASTQKTFISLGQTIDATMRQASQSTINSTNATVANMRRNAQLMKEAAKPMSDAMGGTRNANLQGIGQGIAKKVMSTQSDLAKLSSSYATMEKKATAVQMKEGTIRASAINKDIKERMAQNGKYGKALARQAKHAKGAFKGVDSVLGKNFDKKVASAKGNLNSLGQKLKNNEGHFQGWALSIMFAGMAVMRVMQQIWKTSTKTFQDVQHSVEGTTTGFDLLNGQMKYLQYVAGAALEPLVAQLIPIIEIVSEWIGENEELFASIVKWGLVIGTALMVVGQLVLGVQGLVTAFMNMATVMFTPLGFLIALAGLSFIALSKAPDALDSIKTSIKGIDTSGLQESFGNLFETVFGLGMTWENVGWVIAYVVDKIKPYVQILINMVSILFTSIESVILQFQRLEAWATKADDKEKERLKAKVLRNKAAVEKMASSIGSDYLQATVGWGESVPEFKERMELMQDVTEASAPVTTADRFVDSLTGNGSTFQIGSITIQTDELAKLRSEIEDVSRGAPYKS